MINKLIELLHKIRISMKCCMQSQCSINAENNILDDNIDETTENCQEFK